MHWEPAIVTLVTGACQVGGTESRKNIQWKVHLTILKEIALYENQRAIWPLARDSGLGLNTGLSEKIGA